MDGRAGLLPDDSAIASELRKGGKRVIVVVNKAEAGDEGDNEFSRLGFGDSLVISAEHGIGVGDLLDAAMAAVPRVEVQPEEATSLRIALVGRPNVGKSVPPERLPGRRTRRGFAHSRHHARTRSTASSERKGKRFLFVDTAGIRRSRHLKENVDHVSVVQARQSVERADVAILVLDTDEGLREMDAKVVGEAVEAGRGIIIAVNKWDLARSKNLTQRAFTQEVRDHLKFLAWAPVRFVSATSGKGLDDLLAEAESVQAARNLRVTTGELNRMLAKAVRHYAPKPEKGSGDVKILFATQIGVPRPRSLFPSIAPPTCTSLTVVTSRISSARALASRARPSCSK